MFWYNLTQLRVSSLLKTNSLGVSSQASVHKRVVKSTKVPKPPHRSVVNEVMDRITGIARKLSMPFVQLVGDQPVYFLIVEL